MTIAARLREERERLGFTQTALGDLVRCERDTVARWERGAASPNAVRLATFAAHGLDAAYIITGRRAGVPIEDAAAHPERSIRALLPLIEPTIRKLLLLALLTEERLNEAP